MEFIKERYMIEELADCWKCTRDDVLWEIKQHRLSAIVEEDYNPSTNTLHVANYVLRAEKERYESENRTATADKPVMVETDESEVTPHEFWGQLKKTEKNEFIRAALLRQKFALKDLSDHEAMRLLDPERVAKWEEAKKNKMAMGRIKSLFSYRVKKGEKLLLDLKNMSSS